MHVYFPVCIICADLKVLEFKTQPPFSSINIFKSLNFSGPTFRVMAANVFAPHEGISQTYPILKGISGYVFKEIFSFCMPGY